MWFSPRDLHLYNPEFVFLSLFNPSCLGGDLGSPPVILVTQNRGFEGYSLMASLGACDNKQWPFDSLLFDTKAKLGGKVSIGKTRKSCSKSLKKDAMGLTSLSFEDARIFDVL